MKKERTFRRLLRLLGGSKKTLLAVFALVLLGNVALLLAPKRIGSTIDAIFAGEPRLSLLRTVSGPRRAGSGEYAPQEPV